MTLPERILWREVRGNKLAGFHLRRQQIIDGFIVDFYCHAAGLVIEVDGPDHGDQPEYDAARDRILAARNLRILRIPNDAVLHDLASVLKQITTALLQLENAQAALQPEQTDKAPPSLRGKGDGGLGLP